MPLSLNKMLLFILIFFLIVLYYQSRPPLTGDAAICAELPKDPSTLPFISYSTQEGFDECVSRCMTSVMMQVCEQLPSKSDLFSTRPDIKRQMFAGCTQNIKGFVTHNTRCPHLNCEP